MSRNNDLQEIELTIEQAKHNVNRMEALSRLRKNKDWIVLIESGYFQEEAARLVLSKAEPQLQGEAHQVMLDKMIDGVSYFNQYLRKIYQFGEQSRQAMASHEQTRNEVMAETAEAAH